MKSMFSSLRQNKAAAASPRKATITLGLVFIIGLCIYAYVRILEHMLTNLPVLETQSFPSNVVDTSNEARPNHPIASQATMKQGEQIRKLTHQPESESEGGDVVHVVYSRFMQRQAKLVELGLARAELFRVFCLPTMVQQTNPNFLWIIRTDPKLDKKVLSIMVEMLKPHPNFLLVASNGNNDGWRSASAMSDVLTPKNVLVGNATLARELHDASQTRTVLETRLDADDGLHLEYVDLLQRSSRRHFAAPSIPPPAVIEDPVRVPPKNQSRWLYWCVNSHVEWYPHGPDVDETKKASGGILKGAKERFCATPGLTKGYAAGTKHSDIPSLPHHRLHKRVKECKDEHDTQCLRRIKELFPPALRARTSTSAGMKGVKADEDSSSASYSAEKWAMVQNKFGINEDDARATSSYLRDHQVKIAADNLQGQCTKGHSCKQSSKEVLLKMIESAENEKKKPQ